jgi:hypothetical protein
MATRGVALCGRVKKALSRGVSITKHTLRDTEASQACGTPSEGELLDDE